MNINRYTDLHLIGLCLLVTSTLWGQNRSYDGYDNNPNQPSWGSIEEPVHLITPLVYGDSISTLSGDSRPNPREISNVLFAQNKLIYDQHNLSDFVWVFGQFIDHDIVLTENSTTETAFIQVPPCDPVFDPTCAGTTLIPMMRSKAISGSGTSIENPRLFSNAITAFIDGSTVYGSSEKRATWLRTFKDGKLKTSTGNLLPLNTLTENIDGPTDPNSPLMEMMGVDVRRWFVAGDVRANENVMLTAMHTLFVREHNRLCEIFKSNEPNLTDEGIYQKLGKMVSGFIQSITYKEYLPVMGIYLEPYNGYRDNINPNITNVFAGAAYRFGHTLISEQVLHMDDRCNTIPQGDMNLKEAFFNPVHIITSGIDPIFKGMSSQIQQELDGKIIDDVRNFLFGPPGSGFGMDLAAINIQGGRERGLADYNSIRAALGLGKVRSFQEIISDPEYAQRLEELYVTVDNLDPWVGMLAEDHMPGAIFGETIMTVVKSQFKNLRDGDRFYFETDPSLSVAEKQEIRSTRMSDIVLRNTNNTVLQDNVFKMEKTCYSVDVNRRHLEMVIYPNPVVDRFSLNIYSFESGQGKLRIVNAFGQTLQEKSLTITNGLNSFEESLSENLPPGFYQVVIDMGIKSNTNKIIVPAVD